MNITDYTYTMHDYPTPVERTVHTVPFINKMIEQGMAADMILVTEALQERQLSKMAEQIASDDNIKVVLLAGPSSSGKTSSSKRLCIQLLASMKHPVALSMDNWFLNRDQTPLDEFGKPDFETIYALNLKQFNEDISSLINGEEVALPTFNFKEGRQEFRGETLHLTDDMILVIEGIHALNPLVSEQIAEDRKFKIYAAPQSPISLDGENWIPTWVNRLLRRINRDYQTRGLSAQQTLAIWPSVRRGEQKWIEPFIGEADAVFDTSMLYELAALSTKAIEVLSEVPHDSEEYKYAEQLIDFLRMLKPIGSEQIPINSLMREFIGGSIFDVV